MGQTVDDLRPFVYLAAAPALQSAGVICTVVIPTLQIFRIAENPPPSSKSELRS